MSGRPSSYDSSTHRANRRKWSVPHPNEVLGSLSDDDVPERPPIVPLQFAETAGATGRHEDLLKGLYAKAQPRPFPTHRSGAMRVKDRPRAGGTLTSPPAPLRLPAIGRNPSAVAQPHSAPERSAPPGRDRPDGRRQRPKAEAPSSSSAVTSKPDPGDPLAVIRAWRESAQPAAEFVYLRLLRGPAFLPRPSPYLARVAARDAVDPANYGTLSAAGVTHVCDGAAEFLPLEQWDRHQRLFREMLEIPFFQRYRVWKAFGAWRRQVRGDAAAFSQAWLQRKAFLVDPDFAPHLVEVRRLCLQLRALQWFKLEAGQQTMQQFTKQQERHCGRTVKSMQKTVSDIAQLLTSMCTTAFQKLIAAQTTADVGDLPSPPDYGETQRTTARQLRRTNTTARPAGADVPLSLAPLGPDHPLAARHRQQLCLRLTRLVRLADLMAADALVDSALCSAHDLLQAVHGAVYRAAATGPPTTLGHLLAAAPPPREPAPAAAPAVWEDGAGRRAEPSRLRAVLDAGQPTVYDPASPTRLTLLAELCYREGRLAALPGRAEVHAALAAALDGVQAALGGAPRLLAMAAFQRYVVGAGDRWDEAAGPGTVLDPRVLLAACWEYDVITERLREAGDAAAAQLVACCGEFDGLRRLHEENLQPDDLLPTSPRPDCDGLQERLALYRRRHAEFSAMPEESPQGLFLVQTKGLKQEFLPRNAECLNQFQQHIVGLARAGTERLLAEVGAALRRLGEAPATVEGFAARRRCWEALAERLPELEAAHAALRALFDLIQREALPASRADRSAFELRAGPELERLQRAVLAAEAEEKAQAAEVERLVRDRIAGLRQRLLAIMQRVQHPMVDDEASPVDAVLAHLTPLQAEVVDLEAQAAADRSHTQCLGLPEPALPELPDTRQQVAARLQLWEAWGEWLRAAGQWRDTAVWAADLPGLEQEVGRFAKLLGAVARSLPDSPVLAKVRSAVEEYRRLLPVLQCLRHPAMRAHHHLQVDELLPAPIHGQTGVTLGALLAMHATDYTAEIQAIAAAAATELGLEERLAKVQKAWAGGGLQPPVEFRLVPHKEAANVFVLGSVDDVVAQLEDSQVVVSTVLASRFCQGPLRAKAEKLEHELSAIASLLDTWLECQRTWMNLERIFASTDVGRQWPEDVRLFAAVDRQWRAAMRAVGDNPGVHRCLALGLADRFAAANAKMELILASLELRLEEKRRLFPRFYFLSPEDLLEVLGQARTPAGVQPHLRKMFEGVGGLQFGANGVDVVALQSPEGETVPLLKPVRARGEVERLLLALEAHVGHTLQAAARVAVADYDVRKREEWVFGHPCQLVLAAAHLHWCRLVSAALAAWQGLEAVHQTCEAQLARLAGVVGGELSAVQRRLVTNLITADVHARDAVAAMVEEKVIDLGDFGWLRQLRSEWQVLSPGAEPVFVLQQCNASFPYGYEYQGCQPRLVVTPLTDRIRLTVTGALQLRLGTAPLGPAGTGKTETIKDLAQMLAVPCVVFNCSDGVTYRMMTRFCLGLAQCGAWCCLDEFNRINVEVLSVIASQLTEIRGALLAKATAFTFQGVEGVTLKPGFGAFVTMNPGYAGRTELPDNLKVLFRPVAVMTPDFRLIAEVLLFSEGFVEARGLAAKVTQLFRRASEQLSAQHHYDFGMRALKAALGAAGALRRTSTASPEAGLLIRACRGATVPTLVAADLPLFAGIVSDLFPGVEVPDSDAAALLSKVRQNLSRLQLQAVPAFLLKVHQLYDVMLGRHGVMLVGPAGAGKTACRTALREALPAVAGTPAVEQAVVYPKAVTYGELFGAMDVLTGEWRDGLCPAIVKRWAAGAAPLPPQWLVLDGPVDPLWVESLNSALDDSRLLCLDNGVRLRLPHTLRLLFEVDGLAAASPATVSRCGMVALDPDALGWRPLVAAWAAGPLAARLSPPHTAVVVELFDQYVDQGLAFVTRDCLPVVEVAPCHAVESLCHLLLAALGDCGPTLPEDDAPGLLHAAFAMGYVWALGGQLDAEGQERFDAHTRHALRGLRAFPPGGLVFDYQWDAGQQFVPWEAAVPPFRFDAARPYGQQHVPTAHTVQYSTLLRRLLAVGRPALLVGPSGVGKTAIVWATLRELTPREEDVVGLQFSARTTSGRVQGALEEKLRSRRRAASEEPPLVFIDDLNLPMAETFGAQPPLELARQLLTEGGVYDRKTLQWKWVEGVRTAAACGLPGGGGGHLPPRLQRRFTVLAVPELREETLERMFAGLLGAALQPFPTAVQALATPMVRSGVEVYLRTRARFPPLPAKPHYLFDLRDLARAFQGVALCSPPGCPSRDAAVRLWTHETMRCFYDRLADAEDRAAFMEDILLPVLRRNFNFTRPAAELTRDGGVVFGDFGQPGAPSAARVYEEIPGGPDRLQQIFGEFLDEYNCNASSPLNLVFFPDCCLHLCRLARALRPPRGSAALIGVGGTGKRSLARLAAAIREYPCLQLQVTKSYTADQFRGDLLTMHKQAGMEGHPLLFLLDHAQVTDEAMLDDLHALLNTGEVPGLFSAEEREAAITGCLERAAQAGCAGSRGAVFRFFQSAVRDHLHVCLCLSPAGDAVRRVARLFPGLLRCCTVDWLDPWPPEALGAVGLKVLEDVELESPAVKRRVVDVAVRLHRHAERLAARLPADLRRRCAVTPAAFLEWMFVLGRMAEEAAGQARATLRRLRAGTERMAETGQQVEGMQRELAEMQPLLAAAKAKTDGMVAHLDTRRGRAAEGQARVAAATGEAAAQQAAAEALRADAKRELDAALPPLQAALRAVEKLNKNDITEIRGYTTVPKAVDKTMAAVLTVLQEPKVDWERAKAVLGESAFVKRLQEYDKDNIPPSVIASVEKYLRDPDFTPDKVAVAGSAACKSLCMWVRAIQSYHVVACAVAPKKAALAEAQQRWEAANARLAAAEEQLGAVEAELQAAEDQLAEGAAQRDALEARIAMSRRRLDTAAALTGALASEVGRWTTLIEELEASQAYLTGNTVLASAGGTYFGPFPAMSRTELAGAWARECQEAELPVSEPFQLASVLATPLQQQEWAAQGLPSDATSRENAGITALCCTASTRRWPLLIDPQGQASTWIVQMEAKNALRVLSLTDPGYFRAMEAAIRNGIPTLLRDVDEALDPALEALLLKQMYVDQGRPRLNFGGPDNPIEYDPQFRLYLHTTVANPQYGPDVGLKVALVDFAVTPPALEEQLLADVVRIERPELEEAMLTLTHTVAADRKKLKQYEDSILADLEAAEGNILDNQSLVSALQQARSTAQLLTARLQESTTQAASVAAARHGYKPISLRASTLFFVVADLPRLDPMYQYSLEYYKRLFAHVVHNPEEFGSLARADTGTSSRSSSRDLRRRQRKSSTERELQRHLQRLGRAFTAAVHRTVSQGLYQRDREAFAVLLAMQVLQSQEALPEGERQFLLCGEAMVAEGDRGLCPLSWLGGHRWALLNCLGRTVSAFQGIAEDVVQRPGRWRLWMEDPEYSSALPLPGPPANSRMAADVWDGFCAALGALGLATARLEPSYEAADKAILQLHRSGKLTLAADLARTVYGEAESRWWRLTHFQRALLVKCCRGSHLRAALLDFVRGELGAAFTEDGPLDLVGAVRDAGPGTPILLLLSPGADPLAALMQFAKESGVSSRLHLVSLGQGQAKAATAAVADAQRTGDWAVLQNCHLAPSFMADLERAVASLRAPGLAVKDGFRLWLTSRPTPLFPGPVLRAALKLTVERPLGVRANLQRSFAAAVAEGHILEGRSADTFTSHRLLYGMCFLHSVLLERTRLGPAGWNVPYDFDETDLSVACRWLRALLHESPDVPWPAVQYLIGEIVYGGRVTDPWDRRLLLAYTHTFFSPTALQPHFHFPGGPQYGVPEEADAAATAGLIEQLPRDDGPDVFGLHSATLRAHQQRLSHALLERLLTLQPRLSADGPASPLGPPLAGQAKAWEAALPAPLPEAGAAPGAAAAAAAAAAQPADCFQTLLRHEAQRYNALRERVQSTLRDAQLALRGLIVLTEPLDDAIQCLGTNRVPAAWQAAAYPSLKPLTAWVADFGQRLEFLRGWLLGGPPPTVWLGGFFLPTAFLTAVLQAHARTTGTPLDTLSFGFRVSSQAALAITEAPHVGVFIHGLFMDNFTWNQDEKCMADCSAGQGLSPAPVLHLTPRADHRTPPYHYVCPVYRTTCRRGTMSSLGHSTNFVVAAELPARHPEHFWVHRSAALVCATDD